MGLRRRTLGRPGGASAWRDPGRAAQAPDRPRPLSGESAEALPPLGRWHPALRAPGGAQVRPCWTLGRCLTSRQGQLELEKTRVEECEKAEEGTHVTSTTKRGSGRLAENWLNVGADF